MSMSVMHKYKLITGSDLMHSVKVLQTLTKNEQYGDFTSTAEPIFYGICIAQDYADVNLAKKKFNEFKVTGDMGEYGEKFNPASLGELIEKAMM